MAARKIILSRYGPSLLAPDEVAADLRNMRLWMAICIIAGPSTRR